MSLDYIVQDVTAYLGRTSRAWFFRVSRKEQARWISWWHVKFGTAAQPQKTPKVPTRGGRGRDAELADRVTVKSQAAADFWLTGSR